MVCLLCLQKRPKQIKICSKKGKDLNCCSIIAQHFWLKPKTEKNSTESVCSSCWDVLLAFHQLYQAVAEAHNYFECNLANNESMEIEECQDSENFLLQEEVKLELDNIELLQQVDASNKLTTLDEIKSADDLCGFEIKNDENTIQDYIELCANNPTDYESEAEIPLSMLKFSNMQNKVADANLTENEKCNSTELETEIEENFDQDFQLNDEQSSADENESTYFNNDSDFHTDSDYVPTEEVVTKKENVKKETKNKIHFKPITEYDEIIAKFFEGLECFKCKTLFKNFDELNHHSEAVHKSLPAVMCCERIFQKSNTLSRHVLIHLNPQHTKCSHCNKIFENNSMLQHHLQNNHQCNKCAETFPNKKELQQHQRTIHLAKPVNERTCPECDKEFSTKRQLYEHNRSAHGDKVSCELCGMEFNRRWSLHTHMLNHENYKCNHCSEGFSSKKKLKKHQLDVHLIQADCVFVCPECDKKFPTKRKLYEHKRSVHAVQSVCDICGTHLNSRASFYFHMRKHQEEPIAAQDPVECDICGKVIKYRNNLKQHKEWVHGKRFAFECPVCKKVSASKHALDGHIKRMHNNQSSFPCSICEKVFKSKFDLREHINTHTKEKQFPCEICSKIFFRKATLQRHVRKVHAVAPGVLAAIKQHLENSNMET